MSDCPSCGQTGKRVRPLTIGAVLKDEFFAPGGTDWWFCDSQGCDTVYFSPDRVFTQSQLNVPVGVKQRTGDRPLCYCFGHSVATIQNELRTKGRSDALGDIRIKMKDPGCHCEMSNPSGACCLGSVTNGIAIARTEMNMASNRVAWFAKLGTVIAAVLASSCCWLPLLLLVIGVSGAGLAATLETYRPAFVAITVVCLATAFYFTYRPSASGKTCCAPDGGRRSRTMSKAMLWVVTVLAIVFLSFPNYVGALFGPDTRASTTENMNRSVIEIDGMTCEGCATIVSKAIREVPGVVTVEVTFERHQATVGTDANSSPPIEEILSALNAVGYDGRVRSERE